MKANTRMFGEIEIADEKIITLETGMIGFPDMLKFALIYDEEKGSKVSVKWFQSMDDPDVAFPVVDPMVIKEDYHPTVNNEIVAPLGELTENNTFVLCTLTVPKEIKKMSINLKAPIVINTDNNKGVQLIVEEDYPVKYEIYDLLNQKKAGE